MQKNYSPLKHLKSHPLKKEIFYFIDKLLQETGKIGEYDQKIN